MLGCKNSLEDFEAYHTELKGVADRQSKFNFKPCTCAMERNIYLLDCLLQMDTAPTSKLVESCLTFVKTEPQEVSPPDRLCL